MRFEITFAYDLPTQKWDVLVRGAESSLEALQGFNAVLLTSREATPDVRFNRAEALPDGSFRIHIGQS